MTSQPGLMSAPIAGGPEPGLMSIRSGAPSHLMQLDPNVPPFEWSSDGTAFLWLVALTLGFVLSIVLLGQG